MTVEDKKLRKKNKQHVCIYGNYKSYYNYRIDRNISDDPRLTVLRKEWFEGKDCLDVGCNQGVITINIAKKFKCNSILGIDIDEGLIHNAYVNLRNLIRRESWSLKRPKLDSSEVVDVQHDLPDTLKENLNEVPIFSKEVNLLDIISFRMENFVQSLDECHEKYDTILCLSVTKWIQLNWGDDGLITLFAKIWRLLRPGGTLVLEPQPWKSYTRNRLVSEVATYNYANISIRPEMFTSILIDKIGFRTFENITSKLPGSITGFDRPIFAFCK